MTPLERKLNSLRENLKTRKARILIVGLGSVGHYLLDYLLSDADEGVELAVAGRNPEKLASDVNILRVATSIRGRYRAPVRIFDTVDLNDVPSVAAVLSSWEPDFIVNSSRAYAGLKYGSISWKNVRAYGIWAPLSVKYVRNLMRACESAGSDALVVNTSYSDAILPWLKSAGLPYPDFGSGNLNHLVYRFKLAAGELLGIPDPYNIDVTFAASHFHDVCISKEGQSEGQTLLLELRYRGEVLPVRQSELFSRCAIPMPVDAKRNMMNASSDYEILRACLDVARGREARKLHIPGAFGEIGGYPVLLDGREAHIRAEVPETPFSRAEMRRKNRESIYLDGIEQIEDGTLTYTDELLEKCRTAFGADLPKRVPFDRIDETADFLVREIIEKFR